MNEDVIFEDIFLTSRVVIKPEKRLGKEYAILYPTDGLYLSMRQYRCLVKVLEKEKILDDVIGIDIEGIQEPENLKQMQRRRIMSFNYNQYVSQLLLLENSLLDINGRWTLSVYQDYWAILYADKEIIQEFAKQYDLFGDLNKFKKELFSEIVDVNFKRQLQELLENSYNNLK